MKKGCFEVKIGSGSPIYQQMHLKILEQFKNNVPESKTGETLNISSFTLHDKIKRFSESGEISVLRGQAKKSELDASDLRALRRRYRR